MAISDPRDISGLVLWYSAEAEAGYSDGQSMTGWTDLSGNGNHATAVGTLAPQWEATTGEGGGPAVKFRGTHGSTSATWGYFSLPASVMGSAAAGEIHAQIKSDGADCSLWGLGAYAGSSVASHYPFSSNIYEAFGSGSRKTVGSPTLAITSWRRYNVWSANNDYAVNLDGVSQFATLSNGVLWDPAPIIGHGKRSGGISTNVGSFKGHMSTVVLFDRKLTTGERADLEAWMDANQHGGTIAPTVPSVAATLSGSGALTAATTPVGKATASFSGVGSLAASVVAVASVAASFTGSGDLSATTSIVPVESVTADFSGAGSLTATAYAADGAVPVAAGFTGSGSLSASVTAAAVVPAAFTGSGSLAASVAPALATAANFSGSGSLTATATAVTDDSTDLSTFVEFFDSVTWTGTALTGAEMYFTFPSLLLDPDTTYTVEVDYEQVNAGTSGRIRMYSLLAPTEDGFEDSYRYDFASATPLIDPLTSGTQVMTIGPGVEEWDEAHALGDHYAYFRTSNVDITAIRVTGVAPEPPEPVGTDLTRAGGRTRSGHAVATWEPAVVPPPSVMASGAHRRIRGEAFGPVTMVGTQPTYDVSKATAQRARTRILMGGKDVSFFRDVPTPEPEYQLAEPLGWGPSSVELPQIAAAFETLGEGDLTFCAKGKPVVYQRVDDEGNIVAIDYRGIVIAHDTSGKVARVEIGGHGQGRAALRHKPGPIFRDTLDLGRLAWSAIRDLGLRFEPRLGPTTGIKSAVFGNMSYLDFIAELCAKAWQRDGTQWTLMPDESGAYSLTQKDTTTVHFTVFNDDVRSVAALRSDASEEPNRIFGTGVTPKGQRVRFGVYPGLIVGPPAPYPFNDDSNFNVGTTDEDTDTGDGITVMVRRLWVRGYLSLEDADGTYDNDVKKALAALQRDSGLTGPVGVMTPALWDALFDTPGDGYTTRGSQVIPAAEADSVRRYNRSSSGQVIGKNPAFEPSKLRVDRAIDFGSGFTRHQMRDWAGAEVSRGEDNWHGTITIHGGAVLVGDVAPGATITEADLMDVRAIRPGMNVGLPLFAGGTLLHVSGVEINRGEDGKPICVLTVDTQARDALTVWEIIRRNRETRRNPARRMKGNRASGEIKDSITEWDEIGGVLDGDRELEPGWNRVRVVGGQEGTVSRIKTLVTATGVVNGIEYAIAVFGKPMTAGRLNELVPQPLGIDGDKKWRDNSEELDRFGALYSAGTEAEPCGYGRGKKTDGAGLTGFHIDDAGFSYRCGPDHLLDVLVWVGEAATLRGGRIMRNQLEAGA